MPRIGAVIIGQTPRPDLVNPLRKANALYQFVEVGALDYVDITAIPSDPRGDYLLTTRLRDGTLVSVEEAFLAPLLQQAISHAEAQGVDGSVLLCAGPFDMLKSQKPLYRPTAMATTMMQVRGYQRIAVLSPNDEQARPIREKWTTRGFSPIMLVDPQLPDAQLGAWIHQQLSFQSPDCLVLDYVGHPLEKVHAIERSISIPVIDLGKIVTDMLKHMT